jgi:cell division protein FtsZ
MIEVGLQDVEFVAINTDAQALLASEADVKIDIGRELTRGLGAGSDPEVGRRAAEDNVDEIQETLKGADMVFVTAGEGGGTGTGAAPVVGRIARSLGALTVGVVTRPFHFEGKRRSRLAENGIEELREQVDALITIPNQRLIDISERGKTVTEAFRLADNVLMNGVQGITDLIRTNAELNVDFADVTTVLKDSGTALMGIGVAAGDDRALKAAELAVSSPLLETSIDGARGVLVLVQGPSDFGMHELGEAVSLIEEAAHEDAVFKFGLCHDDSLGEHVRVTVVAAGFDQRSLRRDALGQFASLGVPAAPKLPNSIPPSHAATINSRPVPVVPSLEPELVGVGSMRAPITEATSIVSTDSYAAPIYAAPPSEPAMIISPPNIFELFFKEELDVPDFLRFRR